MKLTIFATTAAALLSSQQATAQELPLCPKGTVGEWEWSATAERTRVLYKKGEWNLGPDVDIAQTNTPQIELTTISDAEKPDRVYLNIRYFPTGLTVPVKGQDYPLFGSKGHGYKVGIAPQSGNLGLEAQTKWRALSRYSLGLFGGDTIIPGKVATENLERLLKGKGVLGLFLFPTFEQDFDKEPVAMLVMPEEGRTAAWEAAIAAHKQLDQAHDKGPGCKTS